MNRSPFAWILANGETPSGLSLFASDPLHQDSAAMGAPTKLADFCNILLVRKSRERKIRVPMRNGEIERKHVMVWPPRSGARRAGLLKACVACHSAFTISLIAKP